MKEIQKFQVVKVCRKVITNSKVNCDPNIEVIPFKATYVGKSGNHNRFLQQQFF